MTKKNRRRRVDATMFSLSAMIDVVFLLLIFFIVTFVPPRVESHLAINQPEPTRSETHIDHVPLEAEVHPDGIRYMSQSVTLEQLEGKLQRAVTNQGNITFFIKVNPSALEGQVIEVLDLCGKIDLKNINLLTLKSQNVL